MSLRSHCVFIILDRWLSACYIHILVWFLIFTLKLPIVYLWTKLSSFKSFLQGYLLKSVLSTFLVTTPSIVKFPSSFLFSAQLVLSKLWLVCSDLGGLVSFSWQLFSFTLSTFVIYLKRKWFLDSLEGTLKVYALLIIHE